MVYTGFARSRRGPTRVRTMLKILFPLLLIPRELPAQERQVDPTWLHRYVPRLSETHIDLTIPQRQVQFAVKLHF